MKLQPVVNHRIAVFFFVGLSSLTISCATIIPYSNEEVCALDNQKFLGLEKQEVVSVIYAQVERAAVLVKHDLTLTKCEPPKSNADKQTIQNLKAELEPKVQFNESFWKDGANHEKALAVSKGISETLHIRQPMQATFPKDE